MRILLVSKLYSKGSEIVRQNRILLGRSRTKTMRPATSCRGLMSCANIDTAMTEIFIWSMWIHSINLNFTWLGRVYDDFCRSCSIIYAESFKIAIKLRILASLALFDHSFCHIFELFSLSEKNIVNLAFLFHSFVPFRLGEHMSSLSELFYSI